MSREVARPQPQTVDPLDFAVHLLNLFDLSLKISRASADNSMVVSLTTRMRANVSIRIRVSVVAAALTLTACAQTSTALQSLNNGLAQVNQALAPTANGTPSVFGPSLSAEQTAQMNAALSTSLSARDAVFRNMVASAQPVLVAVMSKTACHQGHDDHQVLSMYTSARLDNTYLASPWSRMQYAPKGRCLNILRTDSWNQKSLNAFSYRTVFYSPESGESQAVNFEYVKVDGAWLLNYMSFY